MNFICEKCPLLTFSHLRWDFVFQRPQHLLSRHARHRAVYYFEEPLPAKGRAPELEFRISKENVRVVTPRLPEGLSAGNRNLVLKGLVDELVSGEQMDEFALWYYTPMALPFSRHLKAATTIYDCMDELSKFKFAPAELLMLEAELLKRADLVFTGGQSLYEAKRDRHKNIFPFPSSIDYHHFAQARRPQKDPKDQAPIAHPRVGFFGVIDERMDLELLDQMAELRPKWQFVMIGPVAKIEPGALPKRANIHYLGMKSYQELPGYLAGWDLAMMPFALNESTEFISPTKTPEYLAAGRPVVSTPIRDVVNPYGHERLVHIAATAADFVAAGEKAMAERRNDPEWLLRVDEFLEGNSWDMTWRRMAALERAAARQLRERPSHSARLHLEVERVSPSVGM